MSSYFFAPAAVQDLTEIYDFIAEDNASAALRQLNTFEEKCQLLADSPEIGRKRKELAADLRSFPVGNYESGEKVARGMRFEKSVSQPIFTAGI